MQAVRTAGQKYLIADISPLGATLVRYLFGLPFIAMYLGWLLLDRGASIPAPSILFITYGVVAGFLQIIATILLIRLFTLRNFVVGSCYIRTEILITAVIDVFWRTGVRARVDGNVDLCRWTRADYGFQIGQTQRSVGFVFALRLRSGSGFFAHLAPDPSGEPVLWSG